MLLKLCGSSMVEGNREISTPIFARTGNQYVDCGSPPFRSPYIIQDARPRIIDAPLKFIA